MTVLHTESFKAIDPVSLGTDDDTYNVTSKDRRLAVAGSLRMAGYDVSIRDMSAHNRSGSWVVRPDPVNPDRNALVFSNGNSGTTLVAATDAMHAAIRKQLPPTNAPIIGGFSVYIPPEFVKTSAANSTPILRILAGDRGDTTWTTYNAANGLEVFTIGYDLAVRWFTDAPQSSKALIPGRINYIEYKIEDFLISVWIDDVLVLQKAFSLNVDYIALQVYANNAPAGASYMTRNFGQWAFGNWYNLVADAIAPNVRLGPTTRVIGARASADVDVDFQRPTGFTTNAAVVAQGLIENPPATLQSTNVGDMDVYSTAADTATSSGKLVHAVVTKTVAANLESAAHALRPLIVTRTGIEATDMPHPRSLRTAGIISLRSLYGIRRRPTDGKIFAVGNCYCVLTNVDDGAEGSPWTSVFDDNTVANIYRDIAFRSDGMGVLVRSDGKLGVLLPGTDVPVVVIGAANVTQLNAVVVLPDGTFVVVGNSGVTMRSATPDVPASWLKTTALNASLYNVSYHPGLNRLVCGTSTSGSVITSDDKGVTWVTRTGAGATTMYAGACDGNNFMISGQTIAGSTYWDRSADGIAWVTVNAPSSSGAGQTAPNYAISDQDTRETIMVGNIGSVYTSRNMADWRGYTRLVFPTVASPILRGACKNSKGDWLIVGEAGVYAVLAPMPINAALPPLGGYAMQFNASNTNPETGLPWTPQQASDAMFGMRLTS